MLVVGATAPPPGPPGAGRAETGALGSGVGVTGLAPTGRGWDGVAPGFSFSVTVASNQLGALLGPPRCLCAQAPPWMLPLNGEHVIRGNGPLNGGHLTLIGHLQVRGCPLGGKHPDQGVGFEGATGD